MITSNGYGQLHFKNMELTGSSTVRPRNRQLELKDEYSKIKPNIFAIAKLTIV